MKFLQKRNRSGKQYLFIYLFIYFKLYLGYYSRFYYCIIITRQYNFKHLKHVQMGYAVDIVSHFFQNIVCQYWLSSQLYQVPTVYMNVLRKDKGADWRSG